VGLELLLRHSAPGLAWGGTGGRLAPDDIYGWVPQARSDFEAFDQAKHTTYPDRGYPVAIAPADGRPRVVAMGGSTTGGAYQNDDLSDFYPAHLERLLEGRAQVLNQGVGGWTTWQIRRYLADHLDALDPDVLVLYIGHNDLLTPSPLPYAELYAAMRERPWAAALSSRLGGLRTYQGLRYLLVSLRAPPRRVAVPLEDARENVAAILDLVASRGGRTLLATEGLAPDPGPMLPYDAMLRALAEGRADALYVNTVERLHAAEGSAIFLDDCHLTPMGHAIVAEAFAEVLPGTIMDRP
jgi:lysophospholipase L1-like esterase